MWYVLSTGNSMMYVNGSVQVVELLLKFNESEFRVFELVGFS